MDIRDAVIETLVAKQPKESAEQTLGLLMSHAQAAAGALFLTRGRPELFVARGLDQAGIDRVEQVWVKHHERLRTGHCHLGTSFGVFPIIGDTPLLVYLAGEKSLAGAVALESVNALQGLFVTAVTAHARGAAAEPLIENFLETTPAATVQKRQLQLVLERNEWNLARVARLLGVTRVTIYHRMSRLGITRIRIPKSKPRGSPA